ncbi:MAG: glycosyltransferase [Hydrogenophaga sp.]|uniref:glycosyltransferase n=1 Tax=Hydrogenophaga sp. TaxID=1904254 RepID=UPI002618D04B|nr:glycosyltransferase [Hydrogenophaga sp.]MCV0439768.1 glycosyltransferase [Hydrogenophaga sp.]
MNQQQIHYVPQMQSIAERVNKPVRIVQCIQMHNEEEFAEAVLSSLYDEVDRILVIEGAVENRPNATEDGHSTDRTVEILADFKANRDPDNKLIIISIPKFWKDLEEMKQTFLDMSVPGDWMLINDADEFYRPEDIRRLRRAIELNPHAQEFVPNFLHFYGDFNHVAVPGPEWQPQHQRVFKFVRGMKYNSHPVVADPVGHCTYFSPHYQVRRVMLNDFFIYHYGYARAGMDEVMEQKQAYYKGELAKHDGADEKFDQKVKDWCANAEPVLEYDGEHPSAIAVQAFEHNPVRGKVVGNWREDRFYSQVLAGEAYGNIWLCMTQQATPHMPTFHNGMEVQPC